jgi:hypothetical protein
MSSGDRLALPDGHVRVAGGFPPKDCEGMGFMELQKQLAGKQPSCSHDVCAERNEE